MEKKNQLFEFDKCPECGGDILLNSFELICRDCGLVMDKNFKETSYIFDDDKKINLIRYFKTITNKI